MMIAFGFALAAASWIILVALAVLFAAIYFPTIQGEEGYLREHFTGFDEYAAKVPRLLPRLTPAEFPANENASGGRFSSGQWRHHREYNALMGAGAIYLALAVRLFLNHHGVMRGLR
jgi:amino acid transporter